MDTGRGVSSIIRARLSRLCVMNVAHYRRDIHRKQIYVYIHALHLECTCEIRCFVSAVHLE